MHSFCVGFCETQPHLRGHKVEAYGTRNQNQLVEAFQLGFLGGTMRKIYVDAKVQSILGDVRLWVKARLNDDTVQAACMYLTRKGLVEEAELLLERYCSGSLR